MKNIRDIKTGEFLWVQLHAMERVFELRSAEEVVATLRWNSTFGSLADAVAADGHWTFKRTGFFRPQITIRACKSDSNLAVFTPNWNAEGALEFSTGKSFRWTGTGFWRSQWAFSKANGERLIDFEPHASFVKKSAVVKVTPEGFQFAELSLLILIGWYLMLLRSDDDASAAAVMCAVG